MSWEAVMTKHAMFVVVLALLATLAAPIVAYADDTVYTEGTLHYTIANESITITDCFGKDAEVTVPASVAGIPVNAIAAGAFASNAYVRRVNLPDTVTTVADGAIAEDVEVVYGYNTAQPTATPLVGVAQGATVATTSVGGSSVAADGSGVAVADGEDVVAEGDAVLEGAGVSDASVARDAGATNVDADAAGDESSAVALGADAAAVMPVVVAGVAVAVVGVTMAVIAVAWARRARARTARGRHARSRVDSAGHHGAGSTVVAAGQAQRGRHFRRVR